MTRRSGGFVVIAFTIYGQPAPAGSKRALPAGGKRGGRPIVVDDSRRSKPWQQDVRIVAVEAMQGAALLEGPLALALRFVVPRPRGHFGARGLLPSARPYPTVKPDLLKLARGVEDALTGIVYRDDAQIVAERLEKVYGEPARCEVVVDELGPIAVDEPSRALRAAS